MTRNTVAISHTMLPVLLLLTLTPMAGCTRSKRVTSSDPVASQIAVLEQRVAASPTQFDWEAHNELRHLYGRSDPRKSMEHTDIILRNSPMDDYTLRILSGWEIDKDTTNARKNLLAAARKYGDWRFVRAACMVKAGDLNAAKGGKVQAMICYRQVARDRSADMAAYRVIAEQRLRDLGYLEPVPQSQSYTW